MRAWTRSTSGARTWATCRCVLPTIHPSLAICDHGVPWHSIESLQAAATPRADETTLLAASLVARTALDLLLDRALVATAWKEFRGEA